MEQQHWDQYAGAYHDNIVSPLRECVENPLLEDLKLLAGKRVADLGCGIGDLLPALQHCAEVVAIDFSRAMLEAARQKDVTNVVFVQHDARRLPGLKLRLDACIAVNSILQPHFEDVDAVLRGIRSSLKPNGIFLGVFPSMESVLYHNQLVFEQEFAKSGDMKVALRNARRIGERRKYRFTQGVYDDDGEPQKLFLKQELTRRLLQAGFTRIAFEKVLYPWNDPNSSYEDFSGQPRLWDWYVRAS